MTLSLKNSNKDFDFVGWVFKTSWLIYFRSVKFHNVKETHMMLVALVKIVVAQKTTKKIFLKICWEMKTPTRTWKLVHALHYANELLLRARPAFQKLLQTRQTSRHYQKQVLAMIKHCLGNSQTSSIPAWSKEFSYITFLYRTLAKVNALARADITSIHSQRKIKEIFDLKTHPFIN